ncbi:hypothetical protein RhiXN_01261 [Rhizoctonia solani]|uniref:Uncharacterized protein n=1 Tax=Rhizoctonia solani TaxID=456999 RepID=A0A8H8T1P1_9AGAM|nr:uncharacterized protein RhiXN_01261 [Rhizoctonia solani]QRW26666.1 hypothetical protein RhiXN_01261 [Rhizoctonia solani]
MDQVSSALRVFEVEVISHMRVIGSQVDDNEATSIHRQLVFDGPYHLAIVFLTEASPDGGWWISLEDSKGGAGLAPEKVFLRYHIKALTKLANNARSARLFMLSCGTNLFAASCLESIYETVGSRPWHSIILPSTPALIAQEVADILPDMFVHLYYFGASFKSSLLRVWAKLVTTRIHTGFVLMDRPRFEDRLSVSKLEYAAHLIRPFGVPLPIPESLCGCWGKNADWKLCYSSTNYGECFYYFCSSCCAHELHVAIFMDQRKTRKVHGTVIMEEEWDLSKKDFRFDPACMVRMVQSPERRGGKEIQRPRHEAPWTQAGQEAREATTSNVAGSIV